MPHPEVIAHTCDGINVCKQKMVVSEKTSGKEIINIQNTSVGVQFPNFANKSPCRMLEEIHDNKDDFMKESKWHYCASARFCSLYHI